MNSDAAGAIGEVVGAVAISNWAQCAAAVDLPAMSGMAHVLLEEDLDLNPGLRLVWSWIAARGVSRRLPSPRSEASREIGGRA